MGGVYSVMRGNDAKKKGNAEQKYNTIKDNGLKALHMLSGEPKGFADPDAAFKWWKDAKKRKWDDYENPRFKAKPKAEEKKEPEKKPEKKPEENPAE